MPLPLSAPTLEPSAYPEAARFPEPGQPPARPRALQRLRGSAHTMAFLIQVTATAVGILLALAADQWKTGREQRLAAREALVFIHRELQDNRADVNKQIDSIREIVPLLDGFVAACEKTLGDPPSTAALPSTRRTRKVIAYDPTVKSAAWEVSLANQALLRIDRVKLEKIVEAYTFQKSTRVQQERVIMFLASLAKIGALSSQELNLKGIPPPRLRAIMETLMEFRTMLRILLVTDTELIRLYGEVLQVSGGS